MELQWIVNLAIDDVVGGNKMTPHTVYLIIDELNADGSFDMGQPAIEPQRDFQGLPGCQVLRNR